MRSIASALVRFASGLSLVASWLASIIVLVLFIGAVIQLLKGWVGWLAYIIWPLGTILGSPLLVIYPWFSAWVDKESVHTADLWIWGTAIGGRVIWVITGAIDAKFLKAPNDPDMLDLE